MFRTLALAPLALCLTAPLTEARDLTGAAFYRERIALPPDAVLVIDAHGDGATASLRQPAEGAQVPLPFTLDAPDTALRLRAFIEIGGLVAWIGAPVEVPAGTGTVDLGSLLLTSSGGIPFDSALACGGELLRTGFADDALLVARGAQTRLLPQIVSASGARFADSAGNEVWSKGEGAMVTWAGTALPACRSFSTPGTRTFTARGNEPGWRLDAGREGVSFTTQNGDKASVDSLPEPRLTEAGTLVYDIGGVLALTIGAGPCNDSMTGMPHPASASADFGGNSFTGCGGDPADLLAGAWTVTEISGAPVPEDVLVSMDFAEGRVSGRGGCNGYNGGFALTGEGFSFGPAAATMMACDDPAGSTEGTFFAAMLEVSRFDVADDGVTFFSGDTPVIRARR